MTKGKTNESSSAKVRRFERTNLLSDQCTALNHHSNEERKKTEKREFQWQRERRISSLVGGVISLFSSFCIFLDIVEEALAMASLTISTGAASVSRGHPIQSSSSTVAPLNIPTRRFYGSPDQLDLPPRSVPSPNVYVVQPLKNAAVLKDLVSAKKVSPLYRSSS